MNCRQLVELVTDYLDGTLDPAAARRFDVHLSDCEGCVAYLAQMRLMLRMLGEIPTGSLDRGVCAGLLDAFRNWSRSGM